MMADETVRIFLLEAIRETYGALQTLHRQIVHHLDRDPTQANGDGEYVHMSSWRVKKS